MRKKIYIDAGHNDRGWNTGASGNGLKEQDITFETAFFLSKILSLDFDVRLSRPTKETNLGKDNSSSINARWSGANEWGADYFISIHVNAGGGTGSETYFYKDNAKRGQDSEVFAKTVNDIFAQAMGLKNRGVKLDTQAAVGSISVLRNTKMPAILIELSFIDSPLTNPDVTILRDRRKEMANALSEGIFKHLGKGVPRPVASAPVAPALQTVPFNLMGRMAQIEGQITDGTTFVAARQLLEELGYKVDWVAEKRTIVVQK
ncbi:MAG: N-acetylmuramoyl-L-alanine amidase [Defluviitaleaceae bacterium]|nr:N-acetylmuramoyl-L-alanine amidase [Defluviitaleaceae bacterium]